MKALMVIFVVFVAALLFFGAKSTMSAAHARAQQTNDIINSIN